MRGKPWRQGLRLLRNGSKESSLASEAFSDGVRVLEVNENSHIAQRSIPAGLWRSYSHRAKQKPNASSHAAALQMCREMSTASRLRHSRPFNRDGSKSSTQGLYLFAMAIGMIGVTYASVPLYRMFCQATGYGGTVSEGSRVEDKIRKREESRDEALEEAAANRNLTVYFNADVSDGMNWRFTPTQRSVNLKPGQSTLAFYTAHNLSEKAITGVSTYNVTPQQAGFYFNKIQCFCFEEQKLRPGEKIDMPVFFYVDPEFATDERLKGIDQLTLSYTFFKVAEEDDDGEEQEA